MIYALLCVMALTVPVPADLPERPKTDPDPAVQRRAESWRRITRPRTWNASGGKFSVKAAYVQSDTKQVVLRKADGKNLTVPLQRLSAKDQKYAATAYKRHQSVLADIASADREQREAAEEEERLRKEQANLLTPCEPKLGQVGPIIPPCDHIRVLHVVDKKRMLVSPVKMGYAKGRRLPSTMSFRDVGSYAQSAINRPLVPQPGPPVLIKGLDTTGYVTDAKPKLEGRFKVTGTWTYPTAVGSTRTVFVLEPDTPKVSPAPGR